MVVIGVDAHKRTHTLVAVDEAGRKLGERTLAATTEGHLEAIQWAYRWPERRFALEDCRHLTRRLEADLLRAGEAVARVPTRLMAAARRGGRERGKSDPIDALAVARAAVREPDCLSHNWTANHASCGCWSIIATTWWQNGPVSKADCRWHLHELFPGLVIAPKALRLQHVLCSLEERLRDVDGTLVRTCRELLQRCRELTLRANELERQLAKLVQRLAPSLVSMQGCGPLSAAKIVGETAGARRFRSKAAFASWNGTAPIPVWSGNTTHFRLCRSGNRQVNASLHRIAITQLRGVGAGQFYVERRICGGNTKTEALRLLRRRLSDEVFRRLLADEVATAALPQVVLPVAAA